MIISINILLMPWSICASFPSDILRCFFLLSSIILLFCPGRRKLDIPWNARSTNYRRTAWSSFLLWEASFYGLWFWLCLLWGKLGGRLGLGMFTNWVIFFFSLFFVLIFLVSLLCFKGRIRVFFVFFVFFVWLIIEASLWLLIIIINYIFKAFLLLIFIWRIFNNPNFSQIFYFYN